jgi:hypothetical protein
MLAVWGDRPWLPEPFDPALETEQYAINDRLGAGA